MPGIIVFDGNELMLPGFHLELRDDGTFEMGTATAHLRMDMWSYWLYEAVDAAVEAGETSNKIPPAVQAAIASGSDVAEAVQGLLVRELRASMRALASSAFAVDAFYASVKARSPRHPQQDEWLEKRTGRATQVSETLRHHLRITENKNGKALNRRIRQLFRFRDQAVHPGSRFSAAVQRDDIDAGVERHFAVFMASNAINGTYLAVDTLNKLVAILDRGSEELAKRKPSAVDAMNKVLDEYESSGLLLPIERS